MLAPMKPPPAEPRLPKNHQVVLEITRSAGHSVHLTTSEVFTRAKSHRPAIGFSTVYRGIQRLRDLALVDEIWSPARTRPSTNSRERPTRTFAAIVAER